MDNGSALALALVCCALCSMRCGWGRDAFAKAENDCKKSPQKQRAAPRVCAKNRDKGRFLMLSPVEVSRAHGARVLRCCVPVDGPKIGGKMGGDGARRAVLWVLSVARAQQMAKTWKTSAALLLLALATGAAATPGGVDRNGCHRSKKEGWHCHPERAQGSGGADGTQAARDKRLTRECKGRPNAGACLGYAR